MDGLEVAKQKRDVPFFHTLGYLFCRILCLGPVVVCPLFILVKQSSDALHSA